MNQNPTTNNSDIIRGSLFGLIAFFCMAAFGIATKVALHETSAIWVSFIAYLTGTLLLTPIIAINGFSYLKSQHYPSLIGRAVFGTAASFFYTLSMHYIPIVNGTLLFNTAPLFIPLLAILFLKETINRNIWIAVLIGFIGVTVIIDPTKSILTQPGDLIGLASGIFLAIAYLLMKKLTATDPGPRIIFYYLGIGTLLQIPLLFYISDMPNFAGVGFAILAGALLLAAQMALVIGYKYAQASQIGIYQYTSVVFVAIMDWFFWNVVPTEREIIGAILVTFAGILVIRSGNKPHFFH